jgi:hypothetical protein
LYDGTICEGDLIKTEAGWKFVLSDLWIDTNKDIRNQPFPKRLNRLNNILEKMYLEDTFVEPCKLLCKKYVPFVSSQTDEIVNQLGQIDYKVQGICFRRVAKKARQTIKAKPDGKSQTTDTQETEKLFHLAISKTATPGIYQLYCSKVGKRIKHSIARIEGLKCLQLVDKIFKKHGSTTPDDLPIVKCEYNQQFKKFVPRGKSDVEKPDEYTDIIFCTAEKMQE